MMNLKTLNSIRFSFKNCVLDLKILGLCYFYVIKIKHEKSKNQLFSLFVFFFFSTPFTCVERKRAKTVHSSVDNAQLLILLYSI